MFVGDPCASSRIKDQFYFRHPFPSTLMLLYLLIQSFHLFFVVSFFILFFWPNLRLVSIRAYISPCVPGFWYTAIIGYPAETESVVGPSPKELSGKWVSLRQLAVCRTTISLSLVNWVWVGHGEGPVEGTLARAGQLAFWAEVIIWGTHLNSESEFCRL